MHTIFFLSALAMLNAHAFAGIVAPTDKTVSVTGRVDRSSDQIDYQWSGIEFSVGARCTTAGNASILLTASQEEIHEVTISCGSSTAGPTRMVVNPGQDPKGGAYHFNLGALAAGVCNIKVRKVSEAWGCNAPNHAPFGDYIEQPASSFLGFSLPDACTPQPAPRRTRRIEIVGDSISCGYGNLGYFNSSLSKLTCMNGNGAWVKYEDASQAYGPLVAASFDAEYHLQCIAGIGLTHSAPYGALLSNKPNISTYAHRTLPCVAKAALWDYKAWVPDVLMINIGTNDYILPVGDPSPTLFISRWIALATSLLKKYTPTPPLVAVCGPMTISQCGSVQEAVDALSAGGFRASLVNTTLAGTPLGLHGCAGHPTTADHKEMATKIEPAVKAATGW